jgi:hypothetical protein
VIPTGRDSDFTEVLEQRLSVGIRRIPAELPHSSKLEPRDPVGPRRIPTELPCSSYKEGSRQAGRPSGPSEPRHSPDRATPSYYTKNLSFGVENLPNGCVFDFPPEGGIYRAMGDLHRLGRGGNSPSVGRPA